MSAATPAGPGTPPPDSRPPAGDARALDHDGAHVADAVRSRTRAAERRRTNLPENLALLFAACGAVVGAGLGLLLIHETRPLFGRSSIGEVASLASMATAAVAFAISAVILAPRTNPWLRDRPWYRRLVSIAGLAALHGVFQFLLTSVLFAVFAGAFRGVALDHWAGTFWVAAAGAVGGYIAVTSANELSANSLSAMLAAFLVMGIMASAMSSSDPNWWRHHFSALGAEDTDSGFTFNLTLLLAGFALITIGDFVAHDLGVWGKAEGWRRGSARYARIVFLLLGVLVMAVALIPVNADKYWHDTAAQSVVVVFATALVAFPILYRHLPGGFQAATLAVMGLLITLVVLWKGIHYLNTTAFEMGAATTVLVWLLLFVRSVSAAAGGPDGPEAAGNDRVTAAGSDGLTAGESDGVETAGPDGTATASGASAGRES